MAKLTSQLCGDLQLAVCLSREMKPFKDHPSTHGHLTSLRNKPKQKQHRKLSALMLARIVS